MKETRLLGWIFAGLLIAFFFLLLQWTGSLYSILAFLNWR